MITTINNDKVLVIRSSISHRSFKNSAAAGAVDGQRRRNPRWPSINSDQSQNGGNKAFSVHCNSAPKQRRLK